MSPDDRDQRYDPEPGTGQDAVAAPSSRDSPCSRWDRSLPWLLVLGLLIGLPWLIHPWYDPTNDGAMYVLTGRSVVDGEGYSMLGQPFRIRPPGFTYLIAPLLAWQRADPFYALNTLVSLFGVLACALLFVWSRARLGNVVGLLVVLALWFNPGFRQLCNQPMSDVPGVALLLLCLLMESRLERKPSLRGEALLALTIGLSALVRSQIVLLAPAILAMRWVRTLLARRRSKHERRIEAAGVAPSESWPRFGARALMLIGLVALTQVPWHLRNAGTDLEPPADQTRLWSYGTAMWHEDMGDPASRRLSFGEVLERIPQRGGQLLGVLGSRLPGPGEPGAGVGSAPESLGVEVPWIAFGLLGSVLWIALKRRSSSELFVLGSSLLVSLYFSFAPRLVLPLFALALPAAAETLTDAVGWLAGRFSGARRSAQVGALASGAALLGLLLHDYDPRPGWKSIELQHRQFESITERFAARVEDDAVLASNRPWHYAVFMDRPIYALEFVVRRTQDPRDLEALIDRYGINTVLLSPSQEKDREVMPYFEAVYGPEQGTLARVYRVRPAR